MTLGGSRRFWRAELAATPEYRKLPIVAAFSSLSIPDDLVTYLTRRGIYAIAMGDEAMQVLNLDAVRGRRAAPSEQT